MLPFFPNADYREHLIRATVALAKLVSDWT